MKNRKLLLAMGFVLIAKSISPAIAADAAKPAAPARPSAGVGAPGVAVLSAGYYAAVPSAAYTTAVYRGQTCRLATGVYYCPVMYQGTTAWVVTP